MYDIVKLEDLSFEPNNVLFCDTETDGLYGVVTLFQCYVEGWEKVKVVEDPNLEHLNQILNSHTTVWFNASYDLTVLNKVFDKFEDLMILSRLAFPELPRCSLDSVLRHVLGYCPYAERGIVKSEMQKTRWIVGELKEEHYIYASLDVLLMPKIYEKVKAFKNSIVYKQDIETIASCFKMQKNGFMLQRSRALDLKKKLTEELEEDLKYLDLNVNSSKQCKEALGTLTSNEETLIKLISKKNNKSELAKKILFGRKKLNSLSRITKYLKIAEKDGRVYGKYAPTTISGRLRSSNENLQNITRNIRGIFGYEDKNNILIYADYSQLELRTIASILNVRAMVDAFTTNKDVHMITAKKLFGNNATDNQRTLSKAYNFAMLYGASANGIRGALANMGIFISKEKAEKDKRAWLKIYPEIAKWHNQCKVKAMNNSKNRTAMGRVYKSTSLNEQSNILNQGTGAEISKIAFNLMTKQGLKLVNFVHDAYLIESDADNYKKHMDTVAECMQLGWQTVAKVFKVKNVPMPIDVYAGYSWGDIEQGEYIDSKQFN